MAVVAAARANAAWTHKQDQQLVDFINQRANASDTTPVTLNPRTLDLSLADQQKYVALSGKNIHDIRVRIALLQLFNERLAKCFSFIDLAADSDE